MGLLGRIVRKVEKVMLYATTGSPEYVARRLSEIEREESYAKSLPIYEQAEKSAHERDEDNDSEQ